MEEELSFEEMIEQAEQDELGDAELLTPRDYAKLRNMTPQLVYYYLRTNILESERCSCGRRTLRVALADEALQTHKSTRRQVLDTRSDELR